MDVKYVQEAVKLVAALAWPVTILGVLFFFKAKLAVIFEALTKRIQAGAQVETPWISVHALSTTLPLPESGDAVTAEHLALIHSSWRYPKKDKEFGRPMYAFNAIIQGREEVLDRIEYVKYMLHNSYPNSIQTNTDRFGRFKLKELAYGESNLRAEVKIVGQDELVCLKRYINLTETGSRL
jgi:hypothetical protein